MFQLIEGLAYAFPQRMATLAADYPADPGASASGSRAARASGLSEERAPPPVQRGRHLPPLSRAGRGMSGRAPTGRGAHPAGRRRRPRAAVPLRAPGRAPFWVTPGGALDPGETYRGRRAARAAGGDRARPGSRAGGRAAAGRVRRPSKACRSPPTSATSSSTEHGGGRRPPAIPSSNAG